MLKARLIALWAVLLLVSVGCCDRQAGFAACRSLASDLGPLSAYGVADQQGRILGGCNLDRPLVPASILKIATIASALDILGPEYRFPTEFYLDGQQNLLIKGYGAPGLVSEEIAGIAVELYNRGVRRIGRIYVDDSAFALETQVPGRGQSDNPYDAPVGALSVNFNALPFMQEGKRVVSGEPQTPTLSLMKELARSYPKGRYRINICAGGCDAKVRMARYSGELFGALLQRQGILVGGYGGRRAVSPQDRLIYRHLSQQNVEELSRATLRYSSNFMANLLFLACGSKLYGYPATWAKARAAVHQHLQLLVGEDAVLFTQLEGSGLALENRVTARAMLHLLQVFQPRRELLKQTQGVAMKSGTLTGVYNFAGYLPDGKPFVILLNQVQNSRNAVLKRLKEQFAPN